MTTPTRAPSATSDRPSTATVPAPEASPVTAGPVQDERILTLDVVRGVALFGILVMNVQSYAMPSAAYVNPTAFGPFTGVDFAAWLFGYLLCDLKFVSLFSMLFGAGILLSTHALGPGPERPRSFHLRRMGALLGFGLLHAYLVWYGDILTAYAVCGTLVYGLRHRPSAWKLRWGIALALVPCLVGLSAWAVDLTLPALGISGELRAAWGAGGDLVPRELTAFRGGWLTAFPENAHLALQQELKEFPILFAWRASGCMLVGMALLERGELAGRASAATLRRFGSCFGPGLALVGLAAFLHEHTGWRAETSYFLIGQLNAAGSLLVAFGWVGLLALWVQSGLLAGAARTVAQLGRTAFTAYLLQSVVSTLVFRGHGLGWFGALGRAQLLAYAAALWSLELLVATAWLRWFRFGPFEWAWRMASYGRVFPLRRAEATGVTPRPSSL